MGQKLTARTALTSIASGDLLHVVDVSDTTDSADGTSKKITQDNLIPDASETVKGKVELATTAETATGTDATRAVTPDGLHDMTTLAGAAWMKDEDDMASDSATTVPSQQSTKAYGDRSLIPTLTRIPLYAPQGFLINGKISVTDTGSGLTVAIKTLAGTDPSATDPVYCRIGDTIRTISAALSVTKADGTNWLKAGSAELATKEVDYFVYLFWDSVNSAVKLGFSRFPGAAVIGDFNVNQDNEKGICIEAGGTLTAADTCELIGRFAATLSAGAGYTWSVPTYTASNLIQRPIYETRWLSFSSALSGWSGTPTQIAQYKVMYNHVMVNFAVTAGVSNATTATGTLPFINGDASNIVIIPYRVADNSSVVTTPGSLQIDNNANTFSLRKDMATGSWTNTNNKLIYPTAPWNYKI